MQQQIVERNRHGNESTADTVVKRLIGSVSSDNGQAVAGSKLGANEIKDHNDHEAAAGDEVLPDSISGSIKPKQNKVTKPYKLEFVWPSIISIVLIHSAIPFALYMLYTQRPWKTLIFSIAGAYAALLGMSAGSHRLWAHRSYKPKWPVEVLLVILQTMAGQRSIYNWARDHRIHHKFEDTDADPYNIKRGFFFAHIGWLCVRKHPELIEKGKLIDISDLKANPYVMFQHRNYYWMALLFSLSIPTLLPMILWGENYWTSLVFAFAIRLLITLHGTFSVNSFAHYYGYRPYDSRIEARNSPLVLLLGFGEGQHNFHHAFPYDYSSPEFGYLFNLSTAFIDLCAAVGLVYGRRKADPESIIRRQARTGDLKGKGKIDKRQQASIWEEFLGMRI